MNSDKASKFSYRWIFFVVLFNPLSFTSLFAQTLDEIKSLEKSLNDKFGIDRLKVLNELTAYYTENDEKKALRYGRQAESLGESIFSDQNVLVNASDRIHKVKAHFLIGSIYFDQTRYNRARESIWKANQDAEALNNSEYFEKSQAFLIKIDSIDSSRDGFFKRKIKPLDLLNKINSTSLDIKISAILALARQYEKNENYPKAIEEYKKVVNLSRNKGDAKQIADLHAKIAELSEKTGNYEEAVAFYEITASDYEKLGDSTAVLESKKDLNAIFKDQIQQIRSYEEPEPIAFIDIDTSTTKQGIEKSIDRYKKLSQEFAEKKDYDQSLKYYKLYADLETRLIEDEQRKTLDSIELMNRARDIKLLVQENDLNDLQLSQQNMELDRQAKFRNGLILGLLLLVVLSVLFYWLFVSKKRAHNELQLTYDNLEKTQTQLASAEKKIKKLLGQQVSDEIAQALMSETVDRNSTSKFVCIMFLDIRDFTPFAEKRKPEEIIAYQNDVFGFMIEIIAKHNGVINQFMGDGFMATFGAPVSHGNDAENAFTAAVEIVKEVNKRSEEGSIYPTRVGIGLHAGTVVTGNVGTEIRKQYSITGNAVITAARIEQLNKEYKTQLLISEAVAEKLNGHKSEFTDFVETKLKGRKEPIKIYKIA